jgi:hypothetical protein
MSVYVKQNHANMSFDSSNSWVVMSGTEQSIKRKIEAIGTPLSEWDINIYRGILTGCNEAFIISGEKKDELISADPKSAELIRPILRGRDIKRYEYTFADLWLINVHNGLKSADIPRINIENYPAIKEHLNNYFDKLPTRADKGDTPYNLRNCAYMDDFFKQKIIFQEMVQSPSFCLDTDEHFLCLDTGRIIVGERLEYLLALLNSKLFFFCIKHFYGGGGLGGSGVRMKHTFFQKFPAYVPDAKEELYFKATFSKPIAPYTSDTIDKFFYQKYNLTSNEIKIIEEDITV